MVIREKNSNFYSFYNIFPISMNKIRSMEESFKESKVVYLVTFGLTGEKHSRPMTNFNDGPYNMMWFPTCRDTQKVKDIKNNKKVLVVFPDSERERFYESRE